MNAYLWFDLKCVHDGIKEMKFLFAFQFLIFIFEVNNIEGSKILMVTKLFLKEFYCIYFTIFNWISTCIKWLRMQCIRIFILIYIKIFTISIWMCVCVHISYLSGSMDDEVFLCLKYDDVDAQCNFRPIYDSNPDIKLILTLWSRCYCTFLLFLIPNSLYFWLFVKRAELKRFRAQGNISEKCVIFCFSFFFLDKLNRKLNNMRKLSRNGCYGTME